ncbi:MAG: retropepsin-like aspartic protease [Bacteroidales bacterium]
MKRLILLLLIFEVFGFGSTRGQEFSYNQGGAAGKNYFEVIPYESNNDKIIVNVEIGGKVRRFLWDTGSSTIIGEDLFREFNPRAMHKQPVFDSFKNKDTMLVVSLNEIKLGSIVFNGIPASVVESSLDWFKCLNVEGIIGSSMLRNSIVQISSKNHTITITDNQKLLAPDKGSTSKLKLDRYSHPFIQISINKIPLDVLFDSGSNALLSLSNGLMSKMIAGEKKNPFEIVSTGYGTNAFGLFGAENSAEKYRLNLSLLQISGGKFVNAIVETSNSIQSSIGSELLNYGIVTLDYQNKKFCFEPFESEIDLTEKKWPVSPTVINGQLAVGVVWGALKDQINLGDRIIAIDSTNYENWDICNLQSVSLKDKDKATLTLMDKNGSVKRVEIHKE